MRPEILKYLEDIKYSISAIENYTSDLSSAEEYGNDAETIDSVERRLAIIGEALFKINKRDTTIAISDKSKIIKLTHIIVHDYDLITNSTVWQIIQNDLPILKNEIGSLLI